MANRAQNKSDRGQTGEDLEWVNAHTIEHGSR